jgi:hypothetical protein
MTRLTIAVALAAAAACSAALADPPLVFHAGEWMTAVGTYTGPGALKPAPTCIRSDKAMTSDKLSSVIGAMGTKCSTLNLTTVGNVATYDMTCAVAGGQMTLHGVVTAEDEDTMISKAHSHLVGARMAMPDMDIVTTQHRTGPCQPGDRQDPHP